MIADTTFVIDLMQELPAAVSALNKLESHNEALIITTPTLFELFVGVALSKKSTQERQKIVNTLKGQLIVDLNGESAERAGLAHGSLITKGNKIGALDSMIAGIALSRQEKVMTRNVKDFERIEGIQIEKY